jgi:molybdopterin converting factor small subunit
MPIVELPSALRVHADRQARVTVEATTVAAALEAVCRAHPALRPQLWLADGQVRRTIGVFVNEEDVRSPEGLAQALGPRDVVVLITAMAGG